MKKKSPIKMSTAKFFRELAKYKGRFVLYGFDSIIREKKSWLCPIAYMVLRQTKDSDFGNGSVNKVCATHWDCTPALRRAIPAIITSADSRSGPLRSKLLKTLGLKEGAE